MQLIYYLVIKKIHIAKIFVNKREVVFKHGLQRFFNVYQK